MFFFFNSGGALVYESSKINKKVFEYVLNLCIIVSKLN